MYTRDKQRRYNYPAGPARYGVPPLSGVGQDFIWLLFGPPLSRFRPEATNPNPTAATGFGRTSIRADTAGIQVSNSNDVRAGSLLSTSMSNRCRIVIEMNYTHVSELRDQA
jgi:hypothetical protein